MVLFILSCKVVLSFESLDKTLRCVHSSESYCEIPFCAAVYYAIQGAWFLHLSLWMKSLGSKKSGMLVKVQELIIYDYM